MKLKKLTVFSFFAILSISLPSCVYSYDGNRESIKGNGNVVTQDRNIQSFNKIIIKGTFNVVLSQAEQEKISVQADENLLDIIQTKVENNSLIVDVKKDFAIKKYTKHTIYITLNSIDKLIFSGAGNLECASKLSLDDVKIVNSGVGNMHLKGQAQDVSISNSGVGNINASEFATENIKVTNSGVGFIHVNASNRFDFSVSGVGNIFYTGDGEIGNKTVSGIGKIKRKS